jgi:hypothetical protein
VDVGGHREEVRLDRPSLGANLPPLIGFTRYRCSDGAGLLVLAVELYAAGDTIRSPRHFLGEPGRAGS